MSLIAFFGINGRISITKGVDGTDTPVFPKIALRPDWVNPTSAAALLDDGSLWDYLGLPTIGGFNGVAFPDRSPNSVISPSDIRYLPFLSVRIN
ncbi:hypothetical protein [Parabacteroides distasonis]|uniref:hypothetical protein n=1 Tax=Parabacteroides distasonis TaxID=823 RepID=UPI0035B2809C